MKNNQVKNKKMTLKDYYFSLPDPRVHLKKQIMDRLDISDVTFYRYINGEVKVPLLAKNEIASIVGKSVEELFPEDVL